MKKDLTKKMLCFGKKHSFRGDTSFDSLVITSPEDQIMWNNISKYEIPMNISWKSSFYVWRVLRICWGHTQVWPFFNNIRPVKNALISSMTSWNILRKFGFFYSSLKRIQYLSSFRWVPQWKLFVGIDALAVPFSFAWQFCIHLYDSFNLCHCFNRFKC